MAQAIWNVQRRGSGNKISNVKIIITDNAGVAEGKTVTATCNGKVFSSEIKKGIAKLYTSEVGTYMITAGEYSTMLICPYYGQFSTDMYSGVLNVICTEVGGNDKTCQVRSCDDNCEFTDSYNLTQTFDHSLMLTFLGISAGKYLITIDEKYRFFKEIVSIQKVNEVEVELKQWLFRNGDQCVHNTGGWINCKVQSHIGNLNYCDGSAAANVIVGDTNFNLKASAYATAKRHPTYWHRNSAYAYVNIGSKKPVMINSGLTKLYAACNGNALYFALRTGSANDESTQYNTGTTVNSLMLQTSGFTTSNTGNYYVVIGNFIGDTNQPYEWLDRPSDINSNFNTTINEIYLS